MRFSCAALFLAVLCCFPLLRCDSETESNNKFTITSANGPCQGFYIVDNADPVFFDVTANMEGTTYYYSFSQSLNSPSNLYIHIDASSSSATTATTSVVIYIFKNKSIVKTATFNMGTTTSGSTTVYSITGDITYDFSSSTSTTSTTSSSVE